MICFLVEEFSQYFIPWKLSLLTPVYGLEVVNSNGENTKQYLKVKTEPFRLEACDLTGIP